MLSLLYIYHCLWSLTINYLVTVHLLILWELKLPGTHLANYYGCQLNVVYSSLRHTVAEIPRQANPG